MRLVHVGVGWWGSTWLSVIREAADWELAGLVDLNRIALDQAAEREGLPADHCYTSLEDAIAAVRPDAVLVAVPPRAHVDVGLQALEAGCHCLVEKPLAPTVAEAQPLVDRAAETGLKLMASQQYRHKPAPRTARRLIRSGAIGTIEAVEIRYGQAPTVSPYLLDVDEPLLSDVAIHHFDHIRGTVGLEPARVWARSFNPSWSPFKGNASAVVFLETADATAISYVATWAARAPGPAWDGAWHVHGSEGGLYWDDTTVRLFPSSPRSTPRRKLRIPRRLRRRRAAGQEVQLDEISPVERGAILAEFAACIREDRQPETSGADNLRSVALVEAALLAVRRRAEVDVTEVLSEAR